MARLEIEGLHLAMGGRTLLGGLTLSLEGAGGTAIVAGSHEAMAALALAVAGFSSVGVTGGTIRIDGTAYPKDEGGLARLRPGIGLIKAGDGLAGLEAALASEPKLLVCNEPTAGLFGAAHRQLADAILDAQRDRGIGLLLLTADLQLALAMAGEIIVLDGPGVVERGEATAISDRPKHERTRRLLGVSRPRTRTMMRPPIGEPLLEFEAVTQRFRDPLWSLFDRRPPLVAVQPTSFAVRRGEAVGLLGGPGSGKSTLLRLAAGLGRASGGQVLFERNAYLGADLPGDLRSAISLVFPDPHRAFNPKLPVGLSLTEPLRVEQQLLVDEQADRLIEVVRAVGLEPAVLERLPGSFGAFELQLLALARALASRPKLILLDEPTGMLDPAERAEFLVLFNRLRSDNGLTVLAASRDFEVLRVLSDRILVLEDGHIIEGGKPSELAEGAEHEATRRLVAPRYPVPRVEALAPVVADAPVVAEPEVTPVVEASTVKAALSPQSVIEPELEILPPAPVATVAVAVAVEVPPAPVVALPAPLPEPESAGAKELVAVPEPIEAAEPIADPGIAALAAPVETAAMAEAVEAVAPMEPLPLSPLEPMPLSAEPAPVAEAEADLPFIAPAGTMLPPAPRLIGDVTPDLPPEAQPPEAGPSAGDGTDERPEGRERKDAIDGTGD